MTFLLVSWEGETQSPVSVAADTSQMFSAVLLAFRLNVSGAHHTDHIPSWEYLVMCYLTDNGPWRREYPERRGIFFNKCRLR